MGVQPERLLPWLPTLSAAGLESLPQRGWLERLALLVPGSAVTRWLLLGDLVCLVAVGQAAGARRLGVPLAVGIGFLGLNLLGIALTDFYLGLAVFHVAVGAAAAVVVRRARWLGVTLVVVALGLGILT